MQTNRGRGWVESMFSYGLDGQGILLGAGLSAASGYWADLMSALADRLARGGAADRVPQVPDLVGAIQPLSSYYAYPEGTQALNDLAQLITAAVADHAVAPAIQRILGKIIECDAALSAQEGPTWPP